MKCPFCTNEMIVGSIAQDRYAIKWVPIDQKRVETKLFDI